LLVMQAQLALFPHMAWLQQMNINTRWPKSEKIRAMEHALGQQLGALRYRAGWSQSDLGGDTGYSRPLISLAELGRSFPGRDFWVECDKALHAGGVLAAGWDQIQATREAEQRAAALAAQRAREAQALELMTDLAQQSDVEARVTGLQVCPHCGTKMSVVTTLFPLGP